MTGEAAINESVAGVIDNKLSPLLATVTTIMTCLLNFSSGFPVAENAKL